MQSLLTGGIHSFWCSRPRSARLFSGGDSFQDAVDSAREAIEAHVELLVESGESIPVATNLDEWQSDPEYSDAVWALI